MRNIVILFALVTVTTGPRLGAAQVQETSQGPRAPSAASPRSRSLSTEPLSAKAGQTANKLPPLPEGVTELRFSDFFVFPVGPRGLELTDKLRQLDGKKVRILGFMAHVESPPPGTFLLTPIRAHECHDACIINDLPPTTLRVTTPLHRDEIIPYTPELLLLTGTLSIGNRTGGGDQVPGIGLALDPPEPRAKKASSPFAKGAERLVSGGRQ